MLGIKTLAGAIAAAVASVVVAVQPANAAIVLGFNPELIDNARPGGAAVDVELVISGLDAVSLSAFDLVITYNPAVLDFQAVSFGDPIQGDQLDLGFGSVTQVSQTPGVIRIAEISLDDPLTLSNDQASSFVLAQLMFTTTALDGISDLLILDTIQAPAWLVDASDPPTLMTNFTLRPGRVNTTPEPGGMLLLGMAVASWAIAGRRSR